jgi:HAD superfamily hydrolase (TIGR01509 family)
MAKPDLGGIKNIILDMGGVIIDIDYNLTVKAFQDLGVANFESIFTQVKQMGFVDDFEKGKLMPADFRTKLREVSGTNFSDATLDKAWNALILNLQAHRVETVRQLSKKFNLYLLSNNNAIHYSHLLKKIEEVISFTEFSLLFKENYYSHYMGMRKPDKEIFEFVLSKNQLNPSETLFVDDSPQHLNGANLIGIHTLLIDSSSTLEQNFTF